MKSLEELSSTFLTAEWHSLAMLNYEVDPCLLVNFVPPGTELDCWHGKTFISLIGFRFLKTRVYGISFPFHRNFDEVNLRFYVRRKVGNDVRRGVVFVREIVPRRIIAAAARIFYNERYLAFPMFHRIQSDSSSRFVEYGWKFKHSWNKISLTAQGNGKLPENDSLEKFITEHYWGYAAQNDGGCIEYQVQHPQWKVWTTQDARFNGSMEDVYGRELNAVLSRPPVSAFLAEGSAVSVGRGRKL